MLNHIHIKNFAIIEELSLELDNGLTVVTGETGAGKSIMIDAIGLVLGDRAEQGVVRQGADKAEITLTLELEHNPALTQWLEEHDLDSDDSCILRRVITKDGKSRAYINGSPGTLKILRELAQQLVNIHGQHAHQLLQTPKTQRQILDDYAGLSDELKTLAEEFREYQALAAQLKKLDEDDAETQAKIDLLTFQLGELNELNPGKTEAGELEQEQSRLAHADLLISACQSGIHTLYEDEQHNVHQLISHLNQTLEQAAEHDARFSSGVELLNTALIQIDEAVSLLRDIQDGIDADPVHLQSIEERLGQFISLARKHRIHPEELFEKRAQLTSELAQFESGEQSREVIEHKLEQSKNQYLLHAEKISAARRKAATDMSKKITASMQSLGMSGGQFSIHLNTAKEGEWKAWGADQIEFQVAANPGQPGGSLSKVASGGELSRISLAITLLASEHSNLPTMIFDEVDTGIGGGIAEVVGQKLRQLGQRSQVFCVTHLPQVAAQGHQHLQVAKSKSKNKTETRIKQLLGTHRVEEVARMLGGVEITETTLNHAQEMLSRAATE